MGEAIDGAIGRAFAGRGGKSRKMRARLFGLSKKALRRKDKKCKLNESQRTAANQGMQNANNLDEYVQVIFDMFNARTADPLSPPVCDRINLFLDVRSTRSSRRPKTRPHLPKRSNNEEKKTVQRKKYLKMTTY